MIKVYGFKGSGNCLKVAYTMQLLSIEHEWVEVDSTQGDTQQDWYLKLNPVGQIPIIELDDGRVLSQSNAIALFLARDSKLIPQDAWAQACMHQWLFWEQYSHEPYIAVCRADLLFRGKTRETLDPMRVERGNVALDLMDRHLADRQWFAGEGISVADISLVAYTRVADEGGFDLAARKHVAGWVARTEAAIGI